MNPQKLPGVVDLVDRPERNGGRPNCRDVLTSEVGPSSTTSSRSISFTTTALGSVASTKPMLLGPEAKTKAHHHLREHEPILQYLIVYISIPWVSIMLYTSRYFEAYRVAGRQVVSTSDEVDGMSWDTCSSSFDESTPRSAFSTPELDGQANHWK